MPGHAGSRTAGIGAGLLKRAEGGPSFPADLSLWKMMKTSSLDLLEKTQLPPAQARAILQAMEVEFAVRDSALATKSDLRDGLHGLELAIRDSTLASKIELHGLELKLEGMRTELIGEIKGTVRWNFAFWIAQLAAMAGILRLLK